MPLLLCLYWLQQSTSFTSLKTCAPHQRGAFFIAPLHGFRV